MTDRAQLREESRNAVEDNTTKATMAKEALVVKAIEKLTDGDLPDPVKDHLLDQLAAILSTVELTGFSNRGALASTPIVHLAAGSVQPAAVNSASSISSTVADKLQELTEQLGESNDATALDKLLKLTKGLKSLDQPAVARRLALAERVFDQSLANSLEVASGGTELQIEADLRLVGSQLTRANADLTKANADLTKLQTWATPFTDELDKVRDRTARGLREKLMLESAQGKTPVVKSPREDVLEKAITSIKGATAVHDLKVTTGRTAKPVDTKYRIVDDTKLSPEAKSELGI